MYGRRYFFYCDFYASSSSFACFCLVVELVKKDLIDYEKLLRLESLTLSLGESNASLCDWGIGWGMSNSL